MGSERRTFRGLKSGQKIYKVTFERKTLTATIERVEVKFVDVMQTTWGNEYIVWLVDGGNFSIWPLNSWTYVGHTLYGANLHLTEYELMQSGWKNIVKKF